MYIPDLSRDTLPVLSGYSLFPLDQAGQNYIASGQRPLQALFSELFRVLHKVAVDGECMKTPFSRLRL